MPIGAILAGAKVKDLFTPGSHASTFGGNSIACAAGLAVIKAIEKGKLVARARQIGEKMKERFTGWKSRFPKIKDVRGLGAMWGIELDVEGKPVVETCLKNGVNINCTHNTVLRIMPAITIEDEVLEKGLSVVEEALGQTS
jgi:acetylornithine/succinyldiaminopimelate/putrescine aminotransferase